MSVAALANFAVDVPTQFTALLEQRAGLSNGQILLFMLGFQCVSVVLLLRVHAARGGLATLTRLMLFYGICAGGVAIECRVPLFKHGIKDLGFDLLGGVNALTEASPAANGALAAANTLVVIGGTLYAVITGLKDGRWQMLTKGAVCIVVRVVFGLATQLPVPQGYQAVDGDWPPATGSCLGFIFNPSGHVIGVTLLALELRGRGWTAAALATDAVNVLQTVRLIALQGHYTIDVLTALLIAHAVDPRVEAVMKKKQKDD